jgi:hypothetical protein
MNMKRSPGKIPALIVWAAVSLFLIGGCSTFPTPPTIEDPTSTPAPAWTSTTAPPSGPWKVVGVYKADHSIMTAGFLNERYAATGGVVGIMGYSDDGGASWLVTDAASDCRYGIDIVSPEVIWACGGATHVRKSVDGGKTWQVVSAFGNARTITNPCHSASFFDENTGWLANSNLFGSTTDGGTSWTMRSLPETSNRIATIDTYQPGKGYLLDQSGVLFSTQDDGQTWQESGHIEPGTIKFPATAYQLAAMRFSDAQHGLIVVSSSPYGTTEPVRAFHTSDGGQTWTSELVPVPAGPVYLAREGGYLTVISAVGELTLLRYIE